MSDPSSRALRPHLRLYPWDGHSGLPGTTCRHSTPIPSLRHVKPYYGTFTVPQSNPKPPGPRSVPEPHPPVSVVVDSPVTVPHLSPAVPHPSPPSHNPHGSPPRARTTDDRNHNRRPRQASPEPRSAPLKPLYSNHNMSDRLEVHPPTVHPHPTRPRRPPVGTLTRSLPFFPLGVHSERPF